MLGTVCPHFAHIRKTHPRDTATEMGKPHDSMLRMILRRGIAYGEPYLGVDDPDPDVDRGLMFLCYGASIEDQFEFLTRRWSNLPNQPNDGGHDPVIGQRDSNGDRERFIDVPTVGRIDVTCHDRGRLGGADRRRLLLRPADLRAHHRPCRTGAPGLTSVTTKHLGLPTQSLGRPGDCRSLPSAWLSTDLQHRAVRTVIGRRAHHVVPGVERFARVVVHIPHDSA